LRSTALFGRALFEEFRAVADEARELEAFKCDAEAADFACTPDAPGLVLRAAVRGEAQSRAEAHRAVVVSFVHESIKHNLPEMRRSPWCIRIDRNEAWKLELMIAIGFDRSPSRRRRSRVAGCPAEWLGLT
jgi:hypothetical protein